MSTTQQLLQPHFGSITAHIDQDPDFQASAKGVDCVFAIVSSDDPSKPVTVRINHGQASISTDSTLPVAFSLRATPEQWQAFFTKTLVRPYQSFWGMLRVLGSRQGVSVGGDQESFGRHARLWRIVLDRARDALDSKQIRATLDGPSAEEVMEDDAVVGRYVWLKMEQYGQVKIFCESAGSGPQDILFLHTAGSDSRQYHSLMNNRELQARCSMYAFDLPAHGRSSLGSQQSIQTYALDEDSYLEAIGKVIQSLRLRDTIVCGASMAGHICLAAATRARELGIRGSIPCEGCEHLPFTQPIYEIGGADTSLLDPERVCGMCSPTSPEYYKRQIWWQYSSQGYGVFAGDLKFYFRGWDGRGRMENIDTKYCPVYMLTGEYDYSCTTEASKATAAKIPGAMFEPMKELGHFPLTENPKAVLPYFAESFGLHRSRARRCSMIGN